jgi:hypothetical protein
MSQVFIYRSLKLYTPQVTHCIFVILLCCLCPLLVSWVCDQKHGLEKAVIEKKENCILSGPIWKTLNSRCTLQQREHTLKELGTSPYEFKGENEQTQIYI